MEVTKAIVNIPVCTMFSKPIVDDPEINEDLQDPIVDEALYGMVVEVLDTPAPSWYQIRTHYGYEGFVPGNYILTGDSRAAAWDKLPKQVVLHRGHCDVRTAPSVHGWPMLSLTRGCIVSPIGLPENGWQRVFLVNGKTGYIQASILDTYHTTPAYEDEDQLRKALVDTALLYRDTHYRWGGKSPRGIDCSGLVSMAYLLNGIIIYRDAQIKEGFPIHEIDRKDMKPGDLLFFPGHVAMYMGEERYCHSTGRAGDDGFAINSLDPAAPDYRADLAEKLTAVGSYF
jgi:hypothetical protein